MEMMRTSAQSGESLRRRYDPAAWSTDYWGKPIAAMLELIVYLEEVIDFPPQSVSTSHEDLVFSAPDDHRRWVRVHPLGKDHGGPAGARFQIRHPIEAPWSHAVGYAEDVEQAWRLIRDALPIPPAQGVSSGREASASSGE